MLFGVRQNTQGEFFFSTGHFWYVFVGITFAFENGQKAKLFCVAVDKALLVCIRKKKFCV